MAMKVPEGMLYVRVIGEDSVSIQQLSGVFAPVGGLHVSILYTKPEILATVLFPSTSDAVRAINSLGGTELELPGIICTLRITLPAQALVLLRSRAWTRVVGHILSWSMFFTRLVFVFILFMIKRIVENNSRHFLADSDNIVLVSVFYIFMALLDSVTR